MITNNIINEAPHIPNIKCAKCDAIFNVDMQIEQWPLEQNEKINYMLDYFKYKMIPLECPKCEQELIYNDNDKKTYPYYTIINTLKEYIKEYIQKVKYLTSQFAVKSNIEERLSFKKFSDIISEEAGDYRIEHKAPMNDGFSAPLYDMTKIFPEDIYSSKAVQYYGHYGQNHPMDVQSISIIKSVRNKPNRPVIIYRALPKVITNLEEINDLEKQKKYILKYGKVPPFVNTNLNSSKYYEKISAEIEQLKLKGDSSEKIKINIGDWVTINRAYAKEHGDSQFNGRYRIISKIVKAKDLYTDGNSIHEFGYDPQ